MVGLAGRVLNRSRDVLTLQEGIVLQDFLEGSAGTAQLQQTGRAESRLANARATLRTRSEEQTPNSFAPRDDLFLVARGVGCVTAAVADGRRGDGVVGRLFVGSQGQYLSVRPTDRPII